MNRQLEADKTIKLAMLVSRRLPQINVACHDGRMTLTEWARLARPVVDGVEAAARLLAARGRLLALQHLGFPLASAAPEH
jgi:hypothetical protein